MTTPAAPSGNGASQATQKPAAPTPTRDTATGPQTPAPASNGQPRSPDGKYAEKPREAAPPIIDDDPEFDFGHAKLKKRAAWQEIQRGRDATKLLTLAQKEKSEAIKLKAERDAAFEKAKSSGDLGEILRLLQLPAEQEKALISKYVHGKFVEPLQLTEEQRRLREVEAENAKFKAEAEERSKRDAETKRQADVAEAGKALEAELLGAAKAGRIPGAEEQGTPGAITAIRRVAEKMQHFAARGIELTPEQAVPLVREDIGRETSRFVKTADIGELQALWGKEAFRAHAMRIIEWANALVSPKVTTQAKPRVVAPTESKKTMTPQQFLELQKGK